MGVCSFRGVAVGLRAASEVEHELAVAADVGFAHAFRDNAGSAGVFAPPLRCAPFNGFLGGPLTGGGCRSGGSVPVLHAPEWEAYERALAAKSEAAFVMLEGLPFAANTTALAPQVPYASLLASATAAAAASAPALYLPGRIRVTEVPAAELHAVRTVCQRRAAAWWGS